MITEKLMHRNQYATPIERNFIYNEIRNRILVRFLHEIILTPHFEQANVGDIVGCSQFKEFYQQYMTFINQHGYDQEYRYSKNIFTKRMIEALQGSDSLVNAFGLEVLDTSKGLRYTFIKLKDVTARNKEGCAEQIEDNFFFEKGGIFA